MSDQLGLFGDVPVEAAPAKRPRRMKDRAHAATPGTGPEGETCGSCKHLVRRCWSPGGKVFKKCDLLRASWTKGPGTDVRVRDAACGRWEADVDRLEAPCGCYYETSESGGHFYKGCAEHTDFMQTRDALMAFQAERLKAEAAER